MKFTLPFSIFLLACTASAGSTQLAQPSGAVPASSAVDSAAEERRLLSFLDTAFEERAATSPELLTNLGRKDQYDRLNDYTDRHRHDLLALVRKQLREMRANFDPARLSPAGRISYRLFEKVAEKYERSFRWRWYDFPASTNGSPFGAIPVFLMNQHRVDTVADAEAYISRLREVERVMSETSANIERQAKLGIVPPRFNFEPVRADARRVLAGVPLTQGPDMPVFADFKTKVARLKVPSSERERLIEQAREALTGPFLRGHQKLLATWEALEAKATGNRGAWSLPEGEAYYADRLSEMTTTDLDADQIHRIGLDQVARIHGEMERIKERVGFAGTLQQFFQHILGSPQFKYPNNEQGRQRYLTDARRHIAHVMRAAPQWFRRLPKAPLEVRAVEQWRQETAPVAFYNRPSEDGSRPGIYYVNLADMTQVIKPQVEAISYHEAAPGHHFQVALAQEQPNLPKFRRIEGYGAYVEGWGLYAEALGKEMGLYTDPFSEFGMYSTQLWRAVRLVVDTGIHSKRWTREQAIEYFRQNALLSERDAAKEVERYFNWPGQATSYMVGQLKILELRDRARQALGGRFDIRDFHAAVLENGSVPLDVLEELVVAYINERRNVASGTLSAEGPPRQPQAPTSAADRRHADR